nr:hypothetical protein [Candidatus Levybacteria bacterium]
MARERAGFRIINGNLADEPSIGAELTDYADRVGKAVDEQNRANPSLMIDFVNGAMDRISTDSYPQQPYTKRIWHAYRVLPHQVSKPIDEIEVEHSNLSLIKGGRTEATVNDRSVIVDLMGPEGLPQILWKYTSFEKPKTNLKDNILSFFHRGKKLSDTTSGKPNQ